MTICLAAETYVLQEAQYACLRLASSGPARNGPAALLGWTESVLSLVRRPRAWVHTEHSICVSIWRGAGAAGREPGLCRPSSARWSAKQVLPDPDVWKSRREQGLEPA